MAAPWWSGNSAKHEAPDEPWMTSLDMGITGKPRKHRLDPIGLDVLAPKQANAGRREGAAGRCRLGA